MRRTLEREKKNIKQGESASVSRRDGEMAGVELCLLSGTPEATGTVLTVMRASVVERESR